MGLHVDNDENDLRAPVVSVSLGDPALFRLGGPKRGGTTQGLKLFSGDVVVLAGSCSKRRPDKSDNATGEYSSADALTLSATSSA